MKIFIDLKRIINGKKIPSLQSFIYLWYRLHGVKENVADLQQRLQQYQKKNDEMHEIIATLERKVSLVCILLFELN